VALGPGLVWKARVILFHPSAAVYYLVVRIRMFLEAV